MISKDIPGSWPKADIVFDIFSKSRNIVLFLCAALLLLGGCGYKTPPVPPQTVVPKSVENLSYDLNDEGVKLTWLYPVKTIRDTDIENVSSFDLYMAEIPLEDYCGGCPIPFGEPVELEGGAPVDGEQRRIASYDYASLKSGYKYFFKVRSRTSWLAASPDSNIITFIWLEPAAAPAGLTASAGDRQVSLAWQPVTSLGDGSALDRPVRYQVLRSDGGKDMVNIGVALEGTVFVDKDVRNSEKYFYAVQSMTVYQDELVAGGRSAEVGATPVDLTPPLPPTGVAAISTGVGTKVFWDVSDAADLGGYRVYRRAANRDDYQLLGKVEPQYSLFVDSSADGSVRYYYAVTVIDQATPPNESTKSREATAR